MAPDPLQQAIELVDQIRRMPAAAGRRYLFDRYRASDPELQEAVVLTMASALRVARLRNEAGVAE